MDLVMLPQELTLGVHKVTCPVGVCGTDAAEMAFREHCVSLRVSQSFTLLALVPSRIGGRGRTKQILGQCQLGAL